jgi:peptidylprolyl isomerase domain and WD repeat-containing protein 1
MKSSTTNNDGPPSKRPRLKVKVDSLTAKNDIPSSSHYQISYAHRAVVTRICYSIRHDILLTASQDGIVKFWKRTPVTTPAPLRNKHSSSGESGDSNSNSNRNSYKNKSKAGDNDSTGQCLEFIKSYVAHTAPIVALVTSLPDGDSAASVGEDNVIKFYDVGGFDVTGMIQVNDEYPCGAAASFLGEEQSLLAVSSKRQKGGGMHNGKKAGTIYIFSSISLSPTPVKEISLHAAPLTVVAYNFQNHCMISGDEVRRQSQGHYYFWNLLSSAYDAMLILSFGECF